VRLRLNYILPGEVEPIQAHGNYFLADQVGWLHHMVETNPDTNFFYTTDTTDIWPDEPKCICLETGSHACGGPWCAPACPVCFPEENA